MGSLADSFDELDRSTPAERSSLVDEFDAAVKEASKPKEKPKDDPKKEVSKIASFGAGAGAAVGRGVMGVQQLLGKGITTAGEMADSETLKSAGEWLDKDALRGEAKLAAENAPYVAANPKSNLGGEVTGFVLSPVNKLVPGGQAKSLGGAIAQGGAQGAALNAITSTVEEGKDFIPEKGRQAGVGLLGGMAGGSLGHLISGGLNSGIDMLTRAFNKITNPSKAAETLVGEALTKSGVDVTERPQLFKGLTTQVQDAINSGRPVNPQEVERLVRAETLPVRVPLLKGQISRDPMQFAKEQNLRGIQGVGEPIQEVLQAQNKALIENLNVMGAANGQNIVEAAAPVMTSLKVFDAAAKKNVQGAYDAFKRATGKDLDVPITSIAGDYAGIVSEFGESIPSAIRKKFEAIGEMPFNVRYTIEDAEKLIKSINLNYDPKNIVQARALDSLRRSVQNAISDGAGKSAEGTEAAGLALAARSAARDRFQMIESTPALKAAINGESADTFLTKYVINGDSADIGRLVSILRKSDPGALADLQNSVMASIKHEVTRGASEGNAAFSEAAIRKIVNDPRSAARLTQILGSQKVAQLRQLQQVAEDAIYAPVSSAVNRSNTASAVANLVKSEAEGGTLNDLLGIARKTPLISPLLSPVLEPAQNAVQRTRISKMVDEAVNPSVGGRGRVSIGSLAGPGAKAGTAVASEKSRRETRP